MIRMFAASLVRRALEHRPKPVRATRPEWQKAGDGSGYLLFHTAFAEWRGASARDVVVAMYEHSRAGIPGLDFAGWWDHQQGVCGAWGIAIPSAVDTDADCHRFLDALIASHLIEAGPRS